MEPIIIKSKLDFYTFYKISLMVYYKRFKALVVIATFILLFGLYLLLSGTFIWTDFMQFLILFPLYAFILMPMIVLYSCSKAMKTSPILIEGTTYYIDNDNIESKSESINVKTTWKYIKTGVEKKRYFLIYTTTKGLHFLPKDGFESIAEITRFREIIKTNMVKKRLT